LGRERGGRKLWRLVKVIIFGIEQAGTKPPKVILMAKEKQVDSVLGEMRGKIPLYKNGLDSSGEIVLCERGVIVRAEGNTLRVPFSYIKMLEKASEMPLGKVGVEMEVFDQMGERHYFAFGMAEQHFTLIKRSMP
jgi:hypothetical protein